MLRFKTTRLGDLATTRNKKKGYYIIINRGDSGDIPPELEATMKFASVHPKVKCWPVLSSRVPFPQLLIGGASEALSQ